jgi:putative two-component system response regulator
MPEAQSFPQPAGAEAPLLLLVGAPPEAAAELLREAGYRVRSAGSGPAALRLALAEPRPQLILLGDVVAEQDGLELLRRLQGDEATRQIPVLFVHGEGGVADEELALALGAADCISLPLRPLVLLARVYTQLRAQGRDSHAVLRQYRVAQQAHEHANALAASRRLGLSALVRLTQLRDAGVGHHLLRTQAYVRLLLQELRRSPVYADQLDEAQVERIVEAAPLHDLGKVGIPDTILHKPGPLTVPELAVVQTHTRMGAEVIARAEADLGQPSDLLALAKQIARWHHEHWDGAGYPDGLSGTAIPLAARIVGLADAFDAMTVASSFQPALAPEEARRRIVNEAGWQFDPEVVRAFDARFEDFRHLAQQAQPSPARETA